MKKMLFVLGVLGACLALALTGCQAPWSNDAPAAAGQTARAAADKPVPLSPIGIVHTRNPVFSWTPMTGATKYWVLVGDGPKVASSTISIDVGNITGTSWTSTVKLKNNKTYYWKVKGITSGTSGAWSAVASFTVDALYQVDVHIPSDDGTMTDVVTSYTVRPTDALDLSAPLSTYIGHPPYCTDYYLSSWSVSGQASFTGQGSNMIHLYNVNSDVSVWAIYVRR